MQKAKQNKKENTSASRYEVLIPFMDSHENRSGNILNQYEVGADVSHLSEERLKIGLEKGILKKVG